MCKWTHICTERQIKRTLIYCGLQVLQICPSILSYHQQDCIFRAILLPQSMPTWWIFIVRCARCGYTFHGLQKWSASSMEPWSYYVTTASALGTSRESACQRAQALQNQHSSNSHSFEHVLWYDRERRRRYISLVSLAKFYVSIAPLLSRETLGSRQEW